MKIKFAILVFLMIGVNVNFNAQAQINIDSIIKFAEEKYLKVPGPENSDPYSYNSKRYNYIDKDSVVYYTVNFSESNGEVIDYFYPGLVINTYDSLKRKIERKQYDKGGYLYDIDSPISSKHGGHPIERRKYNENNKVIQVSYFKDEETPIRGDAKFEIEYDSTDTMIEKRIYDEDYNLYSILRYEYDKDGLGIYVYRLDPNGEFPTFGPPPITYYLHELYGDKDKKRLIEERLLDKNKELYFDKDTTSLSFYTLPITKYIYDVKDTVKIQRLNIEGEVKDENSIYAPDYF